MRVRSAVLILLGLLTAGCRQPKANYAVPAWQTEIARTPEQWLANPAVRLLRDYVRVNTVNPPGHERRGAEFLADYLRCEGIPSELICPETDRCNLYARIRGREPGHALLLLNHIDTVIFYPKYWKHPPLGGEISQGYLYGRGAYDMKSVAIAQLMAFVDLARSGVAPRHDVIFLAEASEETYGPLGARWILDHRPDLLSNVGCVLNEGGWQEVVAGQPRFWGIEIGQSALGSLTLGANDPATITYPTPGRPLGMDVPPSPAVRAYFDAIADFRQPFFANAFRHPGLLRDPEIRKWIPLQNLSLVTGGVFYLPPFLSRDAPGFAGTFRTPYVANALVCAPFGTEVEPLVREIAAEARRRGATVLDVHSEPPAPASPYPSPATDAIQRVLEAAMPGVPLVPIVNTFTDTTSQVFRARGIPAYGFVPFLVDPLDAARRHGNDERIFLPFFVRGLDVMREVLFEIEGIGGRR